MRAEHVAAELNGRRRCGLGSHQPAAADWRLSAGATHRCGGASIVSATEPVVSPSLLQQQDHCITDTKSSMTIAAPCRFNQTHVRAVLNALDPPLPHLL